MNNDYDENNRYILEDKSFVDTKTNECLNFGIKDLSRVTVQLNCLERYLNDAEQQIAELQKQLEEKEKEINELKRPGEKGHLNDLLEDQIKQNKILIRLDEQLLQQLQSQPAEIMSKIKSEIYTRMVLEYKETKYTDIDLILNNILKEYQK